MLLSGLHEAVAFAHEAAELLAHVVVLHPVELLCAAVEVALHQAPLVVVVLHVLPVNPCCGTHEAHVLEETLARENELMRFWGIIGFCVLLIIIAGLAALHFYKEKRTMEKTLGKDKKLAEMQSELQKKMEKAAQMEQALKELEAHSCELEAALTKKRAQLNDMTRASSLSSARVALADTMNMLEDYVRHGKSVPADCWKQICSAVDSEYPSFRAEIMEQIPRMKDHMLCTCYLVRLGMKNQQIEILTGCPHQTVWNRVNKIKEALNRMDSASA